MSLDEVADIYLPLSRLLNLYVGATQNLHAATATFLGTDTPTRAVRHRPRRQRRGREEHDVARSAGAARAAGRVTPRSISITTDGFLLPARVLEARGLVHRKGFPESYDVRRLLRFMADVKSGAPEVLAPVYSHLAYDIVPGQFDIVRQPGHRDRRRAQRAADRRERARMFVSDFFDFSIYVDAQEADIEQWYIERFLTLRETVFRDPSSYFHRYAGAVAR